MKRGPDFRKIARRLRACAQQYETSGHEMLSSPDPAVHELLSLYREACPAVAFGLRAHADAFEKYADEANG